MREFIREQIEKKDIDRGQLNEIDLKSIMGKVKEYIHGKDAEVNRQMADIISKHFEGEFAAYLKKRIIKTGRNINAFAIVSKYLSKSTPINYENLFELIGLPMLDFFINKTFGKSSIGANIMQMTPFMKKVSTGNSELDKYVFEALGDALNDKKIKEQFKKKLKATIDEKMGKVIDDEDFWKLLKSIEAKEKRNMVESSTLGKIGRGIKNVLRPQGNETKNKFDVLDGILDNIPRVKKSIKMDIKAIVFEMDYNTLVTMKDNSNLQLTSKIITKPIMKHIIKSSKEIYFTQDAFGSLVKVVQGVFLEKKVIDHVERNVHTYLKTIAQRAKEKAAKDKERKSRKTRRY